MVTIKVKTINLEINLSDNYYSNKVFNVTGFLG